MDWVLIFFVLFKSLVFVTGMYFAIKWHYDREKETAGRRALVRVGGSFVVVFALLLLVLLTLTLGLARTLGMDLSLP